MLLAILLSACATHPPDKPGPDPVTTCPEGEVLDGTACVPEACGAGPWGNLPVDGNAVYVNVEAADGGDGSEAAPLTSIQAGVDLAGDRGGGLMAVAAGTYVEVISLDGGHDGVTLAGRCKDMVTIDGSEGDEVPAIEIVGGRKWPDIGIEGVTVRGGTNTGVWVQQATVAVSASDVRENAGGGVVIADAEVSLTNVGVHDSQPAGNGNGGRGVNVEDGAALTAAGCTIKGNTEIGVYAQDAGTVVELLDTQVLDTAPSPDGAFGRGVEVDDGATLSATGCTVQGNTRQGVYASAGGTAVDLLDTWVLDTASSPDGTFGRGIEVHGGAALTAVGCTIKENTEIGVYAEDTGTTVELVDTEVLDTAPNPDGMFGRGIEVEDGAALTATGCTVLGNTETGVWVGNAGSVVDLVDTRILDTAPSPSGSFGFGVQVSDGARLGATGCTVQGNSHAGVFAEGAGTMVDLEDTAVLDTAPRPDGLSGDGIWIDAGGALSATGCTIRGNTEGGVVASGAGTTVDLLRVEILDTAPRVDGEYGRGVSAQDGATLTATGCIIQGSTELGVQASGAGTNVDLLDVEILDTDPSPDGRHGRGINVQDGATLTATGCTVQESTEVGLLATGAGTTAELVDTVVVRTRRGRETSLATGVSAQLDALLRLHSSEVSETEGPGLYIGDGAGAELDGVRLTRNTFAGAVVLDGAVRLTDSTISDTRSDAEWGGGFGVYALDNAGPPTITLLDSTIGPHDYAAVWLDGPGTYEIEGNQLSGSEGIDQGGHILHGNALFAENGVTAWDGATGLRLADNTFTSSSEIGVLLDGSSAELDDNSWFDNGTDVRQQACDGPDGISGPDEGGLLDDVTPLTQDDLLDIPNALVCPAGNVLTAYDLTFSTLYLPTSETDE